MLNEILRPDSIVTGVLPRWNLGNTPNDKPSTPAFVGYFQIHKSGFKPFSQSLSVQHAALAVMAEVSYVVAGFELSTPFPLTFAPFTRHGAFEIPTLALRSILRCLLSADVIRCITSIARLSNSKVSRISIEHSTRRPH